MFLPKKRRSPLMPGQVDSLDAYVYNTISKKVLQDAVTSFGKPPTFPKSDVESDHYEPLCKLLNNCVEACHKHYGPYNWEKLPATPGKKSFP